MLIILLLCGFGVFHFLKDADNDDNKLMERAAAASPNDETAFVKLADYYGGSRYIDANVLQIVPMRKERAAAFCSAVKDGLVKGWVGRVEEVSATTRGDAILRLYLYGPGTVEIENWNERTNAMEDRLAVPQDSPMFATIAGLKSLDLVRFDGEFQSDDGDCFRTDASAKADQDGNLAPTMMSPKFMFKFADMQKLAP